MTKGEDKPEPLKAGQTRVTVKGMGSWVLDENELTLSDAFAIKATGQLTVPQMLAGVINLDPLPLQTLVWFLRMKAGDTVPLASIDFKIADFELDQPDPDTAEGPSDPTTGSESSD